MPLHLAEPNGDSAVMTGPPPLSVTETPMLGHSTERRDEAFRGGTWKAAVPFVDGAAM